MKRSASASKRGRSPTESPQPDAISPKRQERQPASKHISRDYSPTHDTPARDTTSEEVPPPPKMSAFLQLSIDETLQKFQELSWLEKTRETEGRVSQTSKWARCEPDITAGLDQFGDIFVWKGNRVKLHVPAEKNDYIHASPITVKSNRTGRQSKYIAMQAPKETTTDHVWRMVWDELVHVIVMLTTDKSYPYFPTLYRQTMVINEPDEFGDGFHATVTCDEEVQKSADGATEIRKLVMRVDGEDKERIISHLLYTQWPDFGIPAETETASLLNLIELSKAKNLNPSNPRIVHCRAGVGRSGTFIALDHLLGELEAGAFRNDLNNAFHSNRQDDPVFETVNSLRMQRACMVQAPPQYRYIYLVLKRCWEEKYARKLRESPASSRPGSKGGEPTKILRLVDAEDVFTE